MIKITYSLLFVFIALCGPILIAQRCSDYSCVIAKVGRLMKEKQRNYQTILDNLESAENYPDSKPEEIRALRRKVFVAIEQERTAAVEAKIEALKQTAIAKAAEQTAKAVLDKIYFYEGRFGLAYDQYLGGYGFIDKNLTVKIPFDYQEALPFNYTGHAKVKRLGDYYLIDTTGFEYKLATDTAYLDSNILAIDLTEKQLRVVPAVLWKYAQIKILLLRNNFDLAVLPPEIGNFPNLLYADWGGNNLTALPAEIGKLSTLTTLDIEGNKLTQLPAEIGNLSNLAVLHLIGNKLTSLPPEIGNLSKLTTFEIGFNRLIVVPASIGNLSALTVLDLSENPITALPAEIGNLSNLTTLYLNHNKLSVLPDEICKLTQLTTLNLSENQLTTLPTGIEKLIHLKSLELGSNPIPKTEQERIKKRLPNCAVNF